MKLYHGTTEEAWREIQEEGVLWGRKNVYWCGRPVDRVTYLAVKREHAGIYDDKGITAMPCVILEVDLDISISEDLWQVCIYDPIPLTKVKRIL